MSQASFRHRLEYWLVRLVKAFVRVLPDRLARAFGSSLGLLFFALDGRHRRIALHQLHAAFPRKSAAECRAITRATFVHFGRLLTALFRFSGLSRDDMRERLEYEGEDRVHAAVAMGKGIIFFTGHFGFWEVQAFAHAAVFQPISLLARAMDNPLLNDFMEHVRCTTGNRLIYKRGAIRRVLRALEQNEGIAVLIDQHTSDADSVTVDFFNRPAATTGSIAALALRTGAPLIPVFALPLPGGRYRLIYEPPVEKPAEGSADPVRELTQRCTDVLEMYVRRHPHLWLWMHRRWREEEAQ